MNQITKVTRKILRRFLTMCAFVIAGSIATTTPAAETITYFHLDALGSPIAATDAQGNVIWRENYAPYGERLNQQAPAASNSRWYTGHPHDEDTGLTYMGARYYDPIVGRFMAVDPKDFNESSLMSFNRYTYGNNNPYKYVDPDGNSALPAIIWAIGIGIAAYEMFGPQTVDPVHQDAPLGTISTMPGPIGGVGTGVKVGNEIAKDLINVEKQILPTIVQVNPRNLIPTQTRSEMSGNQVRRLTKDMRQNGFDPSKPVDATRTPTGRLEIQDGHHRTEAAKRAGIDKIPVRISE